MEYIVSSLFLRANIIWNLSLLCGIVESLIYWIDVLNYFVLLIQCMGKIMMLFCSWYFSSILIWAFFGQINSELILYEISN